MVFAQSACRSHPSDIDDNVQALAKYAFGLGTLTMGLSTLAFTLFALPVGNGVGTQILVKIFHASPKLASIRSIDEAIVIGAALSLSSSAFVLQLLNERGEMSTKFGAATLGILLLQVCPVWTHHGYIAAVHAHPHASCQSSRIEACSIDACC